MERTSGFSVTLIWLAFWGGCGAAAARPGHLLCSLLLQWKELSVECHVGLISLVGWVRRCCSSAWSSSLQSASPMERTSGFSVTLIWLALWGGCGAAAARPGHLLCSLLLQWKELVGSVSR